MTSGVCVCVLTGTPSAVSSAGHDAPDSAPIRPGSPSADSGSAPLSGGSPPPCSPSAGSTTTVHPYNVKCQRVPLSHSELIQIFSQLMMMKLPGDSAGCSYLHRAEKNTLAHNQGYSTVFSHGSNCQ